MKHFSHIIISIIVGLVAIFIFNLFYLTGLYKSIKTETEMIVLNCIEEADIKEAVIRLEKKAKIDGPNTISIEKGYRNDSLTSVVTSTGKVVENKSSAINPQESFVKAMLKEMQVTIHSQFDKYHGVNLNRLDSLMRNELTLRGLHLDLYCIDMINKQNGCIVNSSNTSHHDDDNAYVIIYDYDPGSSLQYKITMEPITRVVLNQMIGLLVTTFLLIVMLVIAFWYLIKTIINQRTLEEMKDDFTNNMTHELKTPIAVAYSATDTLLNFHQGDNKQLREKYLKICLDQLSRLSGLVENILSMSMERRRNIAFNYEPLPLKPLIEQLCEMHKLKSKKDVVITTDIQPSDLTIECDSTHLGNIFSNLIDNAIKYSLYHVKIDFCARRENDIVVISIKDNGIGISAKNIEHIFNKFYRVPTGNLHEVKGYGLGLYYVKCIIQQLGGNIVATSNLHQGSCFTLTLPVK